MAKRKRAVVAAVVKPRKEKKQPKDFGELLQQCALLRSRAVEQQEDLARRGQRPEPDLNTSIITSTETVEEAVGEYNDLVGEYNQLLVA